MIDVDTLARKIAATHGITTHAAAREVVIVHAEQLTDDPNLWNADTEQLTTAGEALVVQAVDEAYTAGTLATSATTFLEDIAAAAAEMVTAERDLATARDRRDDLIRAAMRTELPRDAIATAGRIKPARLYQIHYGRR